MTRVQHRRSTCPPRAGETSRHCSTFGVDGCRAQHWVIPHIVSTSNALLSFFRRLNAKHVGPLGCVHHPLPYSQPSSAAARNAYCCAFAANRSRSCTKCPACSSGSSRMGAPGRTRPPSCTVAAAAAAAAEARRRAACLRGPQKGTRRSLWLHVSSVGGYAAAGRTFW